MKALIGFSFIFCFTSSALADSTSETCRRVEEPCEESAPLVYKKCLEDKVAIAQWCVRVRNADIQDLFDKLLYEKLRDKIVATGNKLDSDIDLASAQASSIKSVMMRLKPSIDDAKAGFVEVLNAYLQTFKPSVKPALDELDAIKELLLQDDVDSLVNARVRAAALGREESQRSFEILLQLKLVSDRRDSVLAALQERLSPHSTWMQTKGLPYPVDPLGAEMSDGLAKMQKYTNDRLARIMKVASEIQEIASTKIRALAEAKASAEVKEVKAQLDYAIAVSDFLQQIEDARIRALTEGAKSEKSGLPFYGQQFENLGHFLELGSICASPKAPTWTGSGCMRFKGFEETAVRLYKGGLAAYIRQSLPVLSRKHPEVPASLILKISESIKDRKIPEAIQLWDAALKIKAKQ